MKSIEKALLILALLLPGVVMADQLLQYEPAIVNVSGKLGKGKFQHPNGAWVNFWFLKLDTTVSIRADAEDSINVSDAGIKELQLYSNNPDIQKRFNKSTGKNVHVKGTVFHSHTAWHVRPLVMDVLELK